MLWRTARALFTFVTLALAAATVTFLYIGWRVNRTGARDQAQPADVIVILGARVEPDGQPGPDLKVRTLHAVALFQQGFAPSLICTGGFHNDRLSAAAVACDLAVVQGVPAERVWLADGSMTTREDAIRTSQLMASHGWHTAILVSHPLHLERVRLLFENQGITVYPSPTSTDLTAIPWTDRLWLTARETVAILWIGLEELGVPYEWTLPLTRWIYDPPTNLGAN
ncbi:MAG: YdcF family protein [Anaerolineae bacterium]